MRILITGGSGFLGGHLVECLINAGHKCTIYDFEKPNFDITKASFIKGDILDEIKIGKALNSIDIIYHFAGEADISNSNKFPNSAVENNILATSKLLNLAVKKRLNVLYLLVQFMSTASKAVYIERLNKHVSC